MHAGIVLRAVCVSSHLKFSAGALNTNLQEDPAEVMPFFFFFKLKQVALVVKNMPAKARAVRDAS